MQRKKIFFTLLSISLFCPFLFLRANTKQEIQSKTKEIYEKVKPMVDDLGKTNDALDILDDNEIEKLAKNVAATLKLLLPIIKELPKDKKEPSVAKAKPPKEKTQIKKQRASLLKAIGFLYLCVGTLDLNKDQTEKYIAKLPEEDQKKIKQTLTDVMNSLEKINL